MTDITAQQVKELREQTGAGMMDAKKALVEAKGDNTKAIEILRTKGLAKASKKAGRTANEGVIKSYIHAGDRIGVLLELNCETDFVARTDDFIALAHNLALHIAAADPKYLAKEDVDEIELENEKDIYLEQAKQEGKPQEIAAKIAQGKIVKYYEEVCLLEQAYVKDPGLKVSDLLKDAIAKIGENIKIKRFARFELGQ